MRRYRFHIRRTFGAAIEVVDVIAADSHAAVNQLPRCVSWDFAMLESGEFSEQVTA